jgi:hypothetical protein
LRQFPSRYAFDAGQNLPDKEFRSHLLLFACAKGAIISIALSMSPQRSDYIFILKSLPRFEFFIFKPWSQKNI